MYGKSHVLRYTFVSVSLHEQNLGPMFPQLGLKAIFLECCRTSSSHMGKISSQMWTISCSYFPVFLFSKWKTLNYRIWFFPVGSVNGNTCLKTPNSVVSKLENCGCWCYLVDKCSSFKVGFCELEILQEPFGFGVGMRTSLDCLTPFNCGAQCTFHWRSEHCQLVNIRYGGGKFPEPCRGRIIAHKCIQEPYGKYSAVNRHGYSTI